MAEKKKIAVIGAGLGGLAAAARATQTGAEVHLFEQSGNPGGKANELRFEGFRFDTGPSLLTMPFVLEELFSDFGRNLKDYIELIPLDNLCKYFYPDGTVINAYNDTEKFAAEIEHKTSDSAETVKKYLKYSQKIYDLTAELFLQKSFLNFDTFFSGKGFSTLLQVHKIDAFRSMHKANSTYFSDEKNVQLFDRYATYNGSNPYEAPATLNIIQHVEYNMGGYTVKGGIFKIAQALLQLNVELGVNLHLNSKVERILTLDNKVRGIIRKTRTGEEIEEVFDIVISNMDVNNTYKYLVNDEESPAAKRYNKMEPSSSAMVFYFGVEGTYPQLETHNILFSEDYKHEFDQLFGEKVCPDDPTIYIYISSKINQDDARENCENWFVMINAPYDNGQNWKDEIIKTRETVISKISEHLGINLSEKILFERILTPPMIEQLTGSRGGSLYGISSNDRMAAFMRQQNRSNFYKGLYFVGGSAHPGGGIPLVLLSAKIAIDLMKKYESFV